MIGLPSDHMSRKRSASRPRPSWAAAAPAFSAMPVEVGARAERLVAGAREHDDADVGRRRGRVAIASRSPLHHAVRHRVAPLGAVDRDAGDAARRLVQHLVGHRRDRRWMGHLVPRIARSAEVPWRCHARARDCHRHRAADPARHPRVVQAAVRHEAPLGAGCSAPASVIQLAPRVLHAPASLLAQRRLRPARRVVRVDPRLLRPQPPAARHVDRAHRHRVQRARDRAQPGHAREDPPRVAPRVVGPADREAPPAQTARQAAVPVRRHRPAAPVRRS